MVFVSSWKLFCILLFEFRGRKVFFLMVCSSIVCLLMLSLLILLRKSRLLLVFLSRLECVLMVLVKVLV